MSETRMIRLRPAIKLGEIFPRITSSRELENTIKAMQAGSMQRKVVIA